MNHALRPLNEGVIAAVGRVASPFVTVWVKVVADDLGARPELDRIDVAAADTSGPGPARHSRQ
jgi:hypothetical protein